MNPAVDSVAQGHGSSVTSRDSELEDLDFAHTVGRSGRRNPKHFKGCRGLIANSRTDKLLDWCNAELA